MIFDWQVYIRLFERSFIDKLISSSLNDFHWQVHIPLFEWSLIDQSEFIFVFGLSLTCSYHFFLWGVNHWAVFLWPVYMFLCVWLFIDQCISFSLNGISFKGFHWPVQVFLFVISYTEQNILFQQLFSSQHRFYSWYFIYQYFINSCFYGLHWSVRIHLSFLFFCLTYSYPTAIFQWLIQLFLRFNSLHLFC